MVSSINKEPNSNATDLDNSSERGGVFSVARSNTAPPFEKQESILDEMAEFVEIFVVFPQMSSVLPWRNDRCHDLINSLLTRLEMTLDTATPYERVNFPTVYYLNDVQMSFSSYKATETERFIMNSLFQGCGTMDQLGRRTRDKIKVLMADHVKKVEISRENYEQMLRNVKEYASGNVQIAATDQDQPPQQGKSVPAWIREAEALAAQSQPMLEEDNMGTDVDVQNSPRSGHH